MNNPEPQSQDHVSTQKNLSESSLQELRLKVDLGKGAFALIDEEDLARVLAHGSWHAVTIKGQTYAAHEHWIGKYKKPQRRRIFLHRFIMNAAPGQMVMHRNGVGLDCTKGNLRFGTHQENGASHRRKQGATSRFRGVSRHIGRGKPWQAFIMVAGVSKYLGRFDTEEEAAKAYNQNALLHFGEHASLNKI